MQEKNKKLDAYFKAARSQPPAVPLEALKQTIQQVPVPSAGAETGGATSTLTIKKITAMTASIIGAAAIAVGAYVWHTAPQQVQDQQKQVTQEPATVAIPTETMEAAEVAEPAQPNSIVAAPEHAGEIEPEKPVTQQHKPQDTQNDVVEFEVDGALELRRNEVLLHPKELTTAFSAGASVFDEVPILELSDKELKNLGVRRTKDGVVYENLLQKRHEKDKVNLVTLKLKAGVAAVTFSIPKRGFKTKATFLPIFITDRAGGEKVKVTFRTKDNIKYINSDFNNVVNTLVPVLVKVDGNRRNDVLLWFEPTSEFWNLIPTTVAQNEQLAVQQEDVKPQEPIKPAVEKSVAVTAEETKVRLESELGSPAAIVYATVFPNPASGKINLTMGLRKNEAVRVSLVSIEGKLIKSFTNYKTYEANTLTEQFDISGIATGLYILLIDAQSGSRHTQRVVVQ